MTSVVRWVEVHRLAVAGRETAIARDVGSRVGRVWLARPRFADVARLAGLTVILGEDALAFYQLGRARHATGDQTAAQAAYDQALSPYQGAGDHGNEAATLVNIGQRRDFAWCGPERRGSYWREPQPRPPRPREPHSDEPHWVGPQRSVR